MSWLDRLKGNIELISPDGKTFTPNWIGDERSLEKQLGIFKYPKVDREIVQDLGVASARYPLRLHFDGPDNDQEATRFFEAFSARGAWIVQHPTKGTIPLQPIRVTENIEPVESGSITVFDTEWLRPAPDSIIVSPAQLAAQLRSQARAADEAALAQLNDIAAQESAEQINALKSATETSLSLFDTTLGTIEGVAEAADGIRRGIADSLSLSPLDLTVLGGQIQAIMSLPAQVTEDVLGVVLPITEFIDKMSALPDEVADQTYLNLVAIRELFLTSANTTTGLVSVSGTPDTRAQALELADISAANFQTLTDGLDEAQTQFGGLRVDQQYFSQSASFVESARLTATATRYLLEASFDLAVEKRFTLAEDRAPVEITITEYGTLGEEDGNYELFITSNRLTGDDILLLPAGREVVVYD